jgi:hypothetical protein
MALTESIWPSSVRLSGRSWRAVRILVYVGFSIMQRIFSSATRRETLGKHLKVIAAAVS